MRRTDRHPLRLRRQRAAEWDRYAASHPALRPGMVGARFFLGGSLYTIEGCLPRNPVNDVYAVRSDGETFALAHEELPDALF